VRRLPLTGRELGHALAPLTRRRLRGARAAAIIATAFAAIFGAHPVAGQTDTRYPAANGLRLPRPTGTFAIGTRVLALVDTARADSETRNRFGGRPVTVQFWYPVARRSAGGAPYLVEPGMVDSLVQQGYGPDTAEVRRWGRLRTDAAWNAPVADGRHPLVAVSHGFGETRSSMTTIAEELASHGYLVAAFDHVHGGFALLPDGALASPADDSTRWNDAAFHAQQMDVWAGDIAFVLGRLRRHAVPAEVLDLAAAVDWKRLGALGHSSGGLAAVESCVRITEVTACANLDGGLVDPHAKPIADFVTGRLTKPTLFLRSHPIYSDADHARLGRTREQWEASARAGNMVLDSLRLRSTAVFYDATVAGTGHMSFTDAPFVMPDVITRFGGRIIDPDRGFMIITRLIRAFFDEALGITTPGSFVRAAAFPEVQLRTVSRDAQR
jgi:dienelactone hydrolase